MDFLGLFVHVISCVGVLYPSFSTITSSRYFGFEKGKAVWKKNDGTDERNISEDT